MGTYWYVEKPRTTDGERRRLYYVSSPSISGSKSCKFVGISKDESNILRH